MIKNTLFKFLLVLTVIFSIGVTNIFADSTGIVTASKLNVRKGPSIRYSKKGSLYKSKSVTILDESNGWYKINLSGNEGWVSKKYIKLSENSTLSNTSQSLSQNNSNDIKDKVVRTMKVEATAYTAYNSYSLTSTGQKPRWGTIAVDPKVIPYGTKIYIPEFGETFIANDTGGAIKGNKIDIFMNSKKECYNWGRRTIEIQILN